jgi:tetratricopeptide (TPR) repeat protein
LLRDAAYRTLSKKERPALHGKVAEWIEGRLEGAPGELVQLAAYHNAEAGRPEKAVKHWERAGALAREAAQLDEAVNCYTAAMQIAAGRLPLLERRAEVLGLKGELDRAMTDLEEGLRLLGSGAQPEGTVAEDRARFLRKLANHRYTRGEVEEARGLLALAFKEVEGRDVPEEVMVLNAQARLEGLGACNYDEGERLANKAMVILERIPAGRLTGRMDRDELLAQCRRSLGAFAFLLGHLSLAEDLFGEALRHYEKRGDRSGVASSSGDMGAVYHMKGEFDRALECHKKYLEISQLTGDRRGTACGFCNIGLAYQRKGEADLAMEYHKKDLDMSAKIGNRRGVSEAYCNICGDHQEKGYRLTIEGRAEEARREWQESLEWASRGLNLAAEIGHGGCMAMGHAYIGEALWALGEKSRGLEELKLALAKYDELGIEIEYVVELRAKIKERDRL